MSVHMHREIESLRKEILSQGVLLQDSLAMAVDALVERDSDLAERVIKGDKEIDAREIEIEEHCLKIIALHQPVAQDLRFIVGVLKMNNDMERIGDLIANIAKRARYIARSERIEWPGDLQGFTRVVAHMLKGSFDALIGGDVELAQSICAQDDIADEHKRKMVQELRGVISSDPEHSAVLLKMLDVPRHLERIADLSTNICEDVIYMKSGQITRHHNIDDE